jgi:Flp pilus assembly pilin Flp
MNELVYRTYAYVLVTTALIGDRIQARLQDERGQTAAEYVGILLVIGALVAFVATSGIGARLTTEIGNALTKLFTATT